MGHWKRLSGQVVGAPFLGVFKTRSDGALNNLIWWVASLYMAGGLELNGILRSLLPNTILCLSLHALQVAFMLPCLATELGTWAGRSMYALFVINKEKEHSSSGLCRMPKQCSCLDRVPFSMFLSLDEK